MPEETTVEATEEVSVETPAAEVTTEATAKTYTEEELQAKINEAVASRLKRVKAEVIDSEVSKKTKTAEERVKAMETELAAMRTEKQIMELSEKHGVASDVLRQTKLSGDDLAEFAKVIEKNYKDALSSNSQVVNNAVRRASTPKSEAKVATIISEMMTKGGKK